MFEAMRIERTGRNCNRRPSESQRAAGDLPAQLADSRLELDAVTGEDGRTDARDAVVAPAADEVRQERLGAPTGLAAGTVDEDPVHGARLALDTRVGAVEGHRSSAPGTVLARRGRLTAQRGVLGHRQPARPRERHSLRAAHDRGPSTACRPGQLEMRPQSALPKRLP